MVSHKPRVSGNMEQGFRLARGLPGTGGRGQELLQKVVKTGNTLLSYSKVGK